MLEKLCGIKHFVGMAVNVGVNCVVMPINNSGQVKISSDGHSEKEI